MTNIKIKFEAGECNGFFDMVIKNETKDLNFSPFISQKQNSVNLDITLPNKIFFHLSGKNHNFDSELDEQNNIIHDKFIKITDLAVDNKPVDADVVKKLFVLKTENNREINSVYWGFNGVAELDLSYKTSLDFHLSNL